MKKSVHIIFVLAIAVIGLQAAAQRLTAPPVDEPGIRVLRLYNGVERGLPIEIQPRYEVSRLQLIVVDHLGRTVIPRMPIAPGQVDLGNLMPEIWQLRRAVYLQLLENNQPTGPAVVLQPMLSPLTPLTEQATRATTNQPYTRIIGYTADTGDEPLLSPTGDPLRDHAEQDDASTATNHDSSKKNDADNDRDEPATEQSTVTRKDAILERAAALREQYARSTLSDQRVFTGLRAYVEYDVALETTKGAIVVAMRPDEAPNTAWNFLTLASGGFYTDIPFHRIVPATRNGEPFVIQAGDPSDTGDGGPGYTLPIEPSGLPHDFGVISMARADDPDSAGSQFFICLSRQGTARLDGQYCAFGETITGDETIRAIADVELADVSAGKPADPPIILQARVIPARPRIPGTPRTEQFKREPPKEPEPEAPPQPQRVPR